MLTMLAAGAVIGLTALLFVAPLSKATRYGEMVGSMFVGWAIDTLRRPAITVGKHADLNLRRLAFDDVFETEKITDGDVEKKVTMTSDSVHRWGKRPFTFVDGEFGTTFDLRDVLVGTIEHEHSKDGEMVVSDYEFDNEGNLVGLTNYVRAFFELPSERPALSLDLDESVRPITDGAEDASAWERVWEGVKRMFLPRQQEVSFFKMLLPVGGVAGGFLMGFYLFGPGTLPGEQAGSTISIGASSSAWLLLSLSGGGVGTWIRDRINAVDVSVWHSLLALPVIALLVGGGVLTLGVMNTILVGVGAAAGLVGPVLVSVAIVSALPAMVAEPVAEIWATLGFKAFDEPVIDLTEDHEYRVVEADTIGLETGKKHRLCKSLVSFSVATTPKTFGNSAVSGRELNNYRTADPTESVDLLPEGYEPTTAVTNADHRGFVPSVDNASVRKTYVRTDRWLARFKDAATGRVTERAEREATKEFAAGEPQFTDKQLVYMSIGGFGATMAISAVFWGVLL